MASLDLVLSVVLLLCFILGALRGFLLQVVALAALLIGLVGGWLITFLLGVLFPSGILSAPFSIAVIGTVVFIFFSVITCRLGKKLIHAKALAFSTGAADRVIGGVFSLLEGAVILLLLIWFFDCIGEDSLTRSERVRVLWSESMVCHWAHTHNPIAGLTPMRRLEGLFAVARDPEVRSRLHGQPAYARMVENAHYRAVRDKAKIIEALNRRDWLDVLSDVRVRALLADESFWRDFSSVRWESTCEKDKTPSEVHWPSLTPSPAPAHMAPELHGESRLKVEPPVLSRVVLKTGAVIEGAITKEDPEAVTIDVFVSGGVITMSVSRREIERIEGADSARTQ